MFDARKYLEENRIPFATEQKNVGKGWIGVHCPFCNDHSFHGGFSLDKGRYSCWRCGGISLPRIVSRLSNCSLDEAKQIIKQHKTNKPIQRRKIERKKVSSIEVPGKELQPIHRHYLEQRKFDPDKLIEEWNIKGTGPVGPYKLRIIAPIFFDEQIVSYQGRDITNRAELKYKACAKENEIIHHQEILYGIDKAKEQTVIVTEGVFDVWRLGAGSVATFGIDFTQSQILLLAQRFSKAIVCFDREPKAIRQAKKMEGLLTGLGLDVRVHPPPHGDPASLTPEEVKNWKAQIYY